MQHSCWSSLSSAIGNERKSAAWNFWQPRGRAGCPSEVVLFAIAVVMWIYVLSAGDIQIGGIRIPRPFQKEKVFAAHTRVGRYSMMIYS